MMTTTCTLPPEDKLCLICPVPGGCRETDPRCLYHQALSEKASQQKPVPRGVQVLDYLRNHPQQHRAIDIAQATNIPCSSVHRVLKQLLDQNQVTATGIRKTKRWTAKSH